MASFSWSVLWFIITLGVLVVVHEAGHFAMARLFGIKVLRFSVGFGRSIKAWTGKSGTEYRVAWIPLGGYVQMLDGRTDEVQATERHLAFDTRPAWQRLLVLFAGPAVNLVLAWFLFFGGLLVGRPDYQPFVAQPTGLAADAGIQQGDRVLSIDGTPVRGWSELSVALINDTVAHQPATLVLETSQRVRKRAVLHLENLPQTGDGNEDAVGLVPMQASPPPVLAAVSPGGAGAQAGLRAGDRITEAGGKPVEAWSVLVAAIEASAGHPLVLGVQRGGRHFDVTVQARPAPDKSTPPWILGIQSQPIKSAHDMILRMPPLAAAVQASRQWWRVMHLTGSSLTGMISGRVSTKALSGPVSIASAAGNSASRGVGWYFFFLGILSISLGIFNLIPIPMLDGGQMVGVLVELLRGHPATPGERAAGVLAGLGLIAALTLLALGNDLTALL